jgi:DEAD/DEAH box helicase domain-containing protein
LRSASPQSFVLTSTDADGKPITIGTVDGESAHWMVHPGAIYMHEAGQYFVQELNLESHHAQLVPVGLDYYTEAQQKSEIQVLSVNEKEILTVKGAKNAEKEEKKLSVLGGSKNIGEKGYGEIQVTTQVIGFKKLRWFTNENLGQEELDLPPAQLQTTGYWLTLSEEIVNHLRESGAWTNDPNDYGANWQKIREAVRKRDQFQCQVCGAKELNRQHDVHHKIPFRSFTSKEEANRLENLTTLCHSCHHQVEQNVRMRSGLAGLGFVLGNLAPLFLMCDNRDLGVFSDPAGTVNGDVLSLSKGLPSIVLYDLVPAGIGFSQKLFEIHDELIQRAYELVTQCECADGCPACVGPGGENGVGGKNETLEILRLIIK